MLIVSSALTLSAQQSFTYLFSDPSFASIPSGGPSMQPIGVVESPVAMTIPSATCPQTPTINLARFGQNSGLKAQAFFSGTYSIEMIFKFDELLGYNRIIDFSNGTLDVGIYALNSCLNFYPNGSIGTCPGAFDTTNYKQVVFTRNAATKEMRIYFNAELFTTFQDNSDQYVIGGAPLDSIRFFRDDNVVPNEASSGKVALIRMADFVLSESEVSSSFNDFCARITSVEAMEEAGAVQLFPNPSNGIVVLERTRTTPAQLRVFNIHGQEVHVATLTSPRTTLDLSGAVPGVYFYQLLDGQPYSGRFVIE